MVVLAGTRFHRGHADKMHEDDAQADQPCAQHEVVRAHLAAFEAVHGQPGHAQCDEQRKNGQGYVVVHVHRGPKGQHADEVHGPYAACQAASSKHVPLSVGGGVVAVGLALGHVEGGETGRASNEIGEQNQERFMTAVDDDAPGCGKIGEQLQPQPFHGMPLDRVFTRLRYNPVQTVQRQYRKECLSLPD